MTQKEDEVSDTTSSTKPSTHEDFKTKLQNDYTKTQLEGWRSGTLSDARVRPVFSAFGIIYEDEGTILPSPKGITDLHTLKNAEDTINIYPTQTSPTETKQQIESNALPTMYSRNLVADPTHISTFNEFVDPPSDDGNSDTDLYAYQIDTDCDVIPPTIDVAYILGTVSYEVQAKLRSQDLLTPETVVIDREFSDIESVLDDPIISSTGDCTIEFTTADNQVTTIRESGDISTTIRRWAKLLSIVSVSFAVLYAALLLVLDGQVHITNNPENLTALTLTVAVIAILFEDNLQVRNRRLLHTYSIQHTDVEWEGIDIAQLTEQNHSDDVDSSVYSASVSPNTKTTLTLTDSPNDVPSTLTWDVESATGKLSEDAIDVFVEYGFEQEFDEVEVQLTQDKEAVPDYAPTLTDTTGSWYLFI